MAEGDVAGKRRRVRWFQFTLRRLIALQLLIVLAWWMFNDVHCSTGRNLKGAWIKPKLRAVHGLREIAIYNAAGDRCVCFYMNDDAYLPLAFVSRRDGAFIVQFRGGKQWRVL